MDSIGVHHHVRYLRANRRPWLHDEPPIPFRYGDYGFLKRDCRPLDHRRDAGHFHVLASVVVEAERNILPSLGARRSGWAAWLGGSG